MSKPKEITCPLCKGKKGYVVHGHGWTVCNKCKGAGVVQK